MIGNLFEHGSRNIGSIIVLLCGIVDHYDDRVLRMICREISCKGALVLNVIALFSISLVVFCYLCSTCFPGDLVQRTFDDSCGASLHHSLQHLSGFGQGCLRAY